MNLESTLEDLEAQGYFASQIETNEASSNTCRLVRITFASELPDKYLASPILGGNFIGGFVANRSSSAWHAVNLSTISKIETLAGQNLLETKATLLEVVERHLVQVALELVLAKSRVFGEVTAIDGSCLRFLTQDFRLLWIPESSICEVVVENLSKHFKL